MNYASKAKRSYHYIIDTVIVHVGQGFIYFFLFPLSFDTPDFYSLYILTTFSYYFSMEAIKGQTFGKMLTKTKVVMVNNSKLTLKAAFFRTVYRFNPFDSFSYLCGLGGNGTHDLMSNSKVVDVIKL